MLIEVFHGGARGNYRFGPVRVLRVSVSSSKGEARFLSGTFTHGDLPLRHVALKAMLSIGS